MHTVERCESFDMIASADATLPYGYDPEEPPFIDLDDEERDEATQEPLVLPPPVIDSEAESF